LVRAILLSLVAVLACGAAHAEPGPLVLSASPDSGNVAVVSTVGERNTLRIRQVADTATSAPNRIVVSLTGTGHGGVSPGTLSPEPLIADLLWGSLQQTGEGHAMVLAVTGQDNLLAAVQSGAANSLTGTVQGMANRAAVSQAGTGNNAVFFQAGTGNSVSIMQRSW
jgi:hypothetical protein